MSKSYLIVEWNDTETDTKEKVERLAEAMAYKYVACESDTTEDVKQVLLMIIRHPMQMMY